jgi:hypothetical protein
MSLSIMYQPRFKFRGRDEGALGNFLKLEITDFKLNHGWHFDLMLEELDILLSELLWNERNHFYRQENGRIGEHPANRVVQEEIN